MEKGKPSMESSSTQLHYRKRKKQSQSPSNPFVGIFTRSKSQVYVHRNRSGCSRYDACGKSHLHFRRNPVLSSDSFLGKPTSVQSGPGKQTASEPVEASLELIDKITPRVTSIKDLRARRVFSPAVVAILEEEKGKIHEDSKLLKDLDHPADFDRGKDSDKGNKKFEEKKQSGQMMPPEADASKNGVNLMKREAIPGNGSIYRSQTVLNSCAKRKVFKTPSSFSYRRLLPYLMDMVKEESGVSRIEIVDVESPYKLNELGGSSPTMPSNMENGCVAKSECIRARFNPTKRSENEVIQEFDNEQPGILQNMSSVENQLKHGNHEKGASGFENYVEEECIQINPNPDTLSAALVKDSGKNLEVNTLLAEKPILKGTSIRCASIDNRSRRSPTGKSDTNWKTGALPSPCSRVRIFKASSSVSYRRLFPYLIDVAKQNSCSSDVIQRPKPQIDSKDVQPLSFATSDEENPVKKIRMENFCKQSLSEDEVQALLPDIVLPANGLSSDIDKNLSPSTPPLYSINGSSKMGPSSIVFDDTTDTMTLDLPLEGRLLVQNNPNKFETEIPHNDTIDCDGKSNGSAVQSCSVVDCDILTRESCSELPEPQPVGTHTECVAVSSEVHKSNKQLIQKVTSHRSPYRLEVSDTSIAPTDGPFKGILKRNPKGCRGACNCLNCASFRLHAERAFEFSKNQMHDAEEIAWKLMNELAEVRHMLEKSAVNKNDVTTIQLNQVKQVCNKTLETENLAKERLNQLNYELNVHCRIPALQRPSVTFANHIQERIIPKTDLSTSLEALHKSNKEKP